MYRKNDTQQRHTGFTLIELLVVIGIISLLASIVTVATANARKKARDVKRLAEARSIINVLLMEQLENGHFPCHAVESSHSNPNTFMEFLVTRGYMSDNPRDPINKGWGTNYEYETFKGAPGAPCGQYAYFGIYAENPPITCPPYGVTGICNEFGCIQNNHCHILLPGPLPCSEPYLESDRFPPPADCYRDLSADNEWLP